MGISFTEKHADTVDFTIQADEHIYSKKSQFQKIDFYKSKEFGTFFTLDDILMTTEKDEFIYHEMISHIPMAVNPDIKTVLVIGGGDGGTVRELTRYPTIERIEMVEIDEMVVRACQKYLPQTASMLGDLRVELFFEDGIKYISGKKEMYDLILVDSTDPIGPGEGLFSKQFYKDCFVALKENGILINQHESPFYENDRMEMLRAHSKIKGIFPISKVYQFNVPTYASGNWLFGFASKKLHPIADFKRDEWEKFKIYTRYYNTDLHCASFALPTYVREMLEKA